MPGTFFIIGCILIPLGFGLVPGLLPTRVPIVARWGLWLVVIALASWFLVAVGDLPSPFPSLARISFWLSSLLSLYVLLVDTRRVGRRRRLARS
jgi:hypothetical protein